LTPSNTSIAVNNDRNVNKCWFLLSLTQLSIWSNKFLGKGFKPTIWSRVCNLHMECDFLYNIHAKNELCGGCSNNTFDSKTRASSKVCKRHNKDPIVKLGSFGHNSLEYCAYFSSSWPCAIILVRVMGNCPSSYIILLHTYNLGSTIFAWSILSWIMYRNASFDCTDFVLQIWYNFLHDSWCKISFLSFASYSKTSLLLFPNLDIKSFKDSQIMHFANIDPHFHTSTFNGVFSSTYL
jgi:hypothetical protein